MAAEDVEVRAANIGTATAAREGTDRFVGLSGTLVARRRQLRYFARMSCRVSYPRLALALLFVGCASTPRGFTDKGFVAEHAGYRISYVDPDSRRAMPSDWEIENYFVDGQNRPTTEKTDGIFQDSMDWVESNGRTREVTYTPHDLKCRHGNGSLIVVATVAVPHRLRKLRLSAVAESWANSYSGMTFSFAEAGAKRLASKILESKNRVVDGRPAREVTFDVVNVDQLQLDPQAPRTRIRAIFVQAPLFKPFIRPGMSVPAFLFVGYVSSERKFDELLQDYESLLLRISIPK